MALGANGARWGLGSRGALRLFVVIVVDALIVTEGYCLAVLAGWLDDTVSGRASVITMVLLTGVSTTQVIWGNARVAQLGLEARAKLFGRTLDDQLTHEMSSESLGPIFHREVERIEREYERVKNELGRLRAESTADDPTTDGDDDK